METETQLKKVQQPENEYIVIKLRDGQVLAFTTEEYYKQAPAFPLEIAAVIKARNEAEAGFKFALKHLPQKEALQKVLADYLEKRDWTFYPKPFSSDISEQDFLGLCELVYDSPLRNLTRVENNDGIITYE